MFSYSKLKQKLTSIHRRSAFYVVTPPPSKAATSTNGTKTKLNSTVNSNSNKSTNDCQPQTKLTIAARKPIKFNNTKAKAPPPPPPPLTAPPKVPVVPVAPPKPNRRIRNNKVTNHVLQENAVHTTTLKISNADQKNNKMLKQSREQLLIQEKEDFQLATLLQGYENTNHMAANNRSTRYSLRSRGKMSSITNVDDCNGNGITKHNNTHSLVSNNTDAQLVESETGIQKRKRKTANAVSDSNAIITRKTRRKC